ncbi:MAG: hypothetical protein KBS86_00230 [Proteobacteria bacterium]|nr:hypothetical protein [Candidatus Enterousia scatequi]
MYKVFSFVVLCLIVTGTWADDGVARGRAGLAGAARVTTLAQLQSSKKQTPNIQVADSAIPMDPEKTGPSIVDQNEAKPAPQQDRKDMREKERSACLNNNIGVGNTFVWASRYSNTSNYSYMVEDMEEPENNVCFVKVDMRSDDARISLSDVPSKYFQWGQNITCGSWTDEDSLRQRILDAKKTGRTWGTVAGAVGGAGLGVGAMELFGNKLIGGAVEGQQRKDLSDVEKLQAQLSNLKRENESAYNDLVEDMRNLEKACLAAGDNAPSICDSDYIRVLDKLNK